ncbi:hypothetical protein E2C01_043019 [Portunus trituberculatus]|uniref:Uncharacterized protein n=1 Tax=Portunus trituberculatus TaxID=210409 RepID=A0A5B7FW69_PORTR|nr:hypothetical protein [Portunus trituberculatus]
MKCGWVRSAAFIRVGVIVVDGLEGPLCSVGSGSGVEGTAISASLSWPLCPPSHGTPTPDTPLTIRGHPMLASRDLSSMLLPSSQPCLLHQPLAFLCLSLYHSRHFLAN